MRGRLLLEILHHKTGDAPAEASICLPAWNRESMVADALASALAQQSCRLEVLLSDDCSTDGTLAVALAAAKAYDGPHAVTVCRAPRRLRTGHKPAIAALASAPLIVNFDSDDLSRSDRVARLLALHGGTGAALVSSASHVIRDGCRRAEAETAPEGMLPPEAVLAAGTGELLMGAKYAADRRLFRDFPVLDWDYAPVPPDTVLPFRALLCGGVWHHAESLLDRRIHPGRWSARQDDRSSAESLGFSLALRRLQSLQVMGRDLDFARRSGLVDDGRAGELGRLLERETARQLETLLAHRAVLAGRFLEPVWVDAERLAEPGDASGG